MSGKVNMSDIIQELCQEKKMSIAELERRANLSNGSIKRWASAYPSIDKVDRVAKLLNTTIEYLYTGKIKNESLTAARKMESLNEIELKCINDMIDFYLFKKNN